MINLSKHFSLDELISTSLIYDNTPSEHIIENLKRTCAEMEKVRALFDKPIVVTSGFRSSMVNNSIGGAKNSDHLYGFAVDFKIEGFTPYEIVEKIAESDIEFKQLLNEFQRWVHISFEPGKNRKEVLTSSTGKVKPVWTAGNHK